MSAYRLNPFALALRGPRWFGGALGALAPGLLLAGPLGEQVAAGMATVVRDAVTTQIDQVTDRAIVNWQSFNVGPDEFVIFNQPSASAVVLNRVVGGAPSGIDGSLMANGRVFLVNPQGILFGQSAQVDVGALVASTLEIADNNFLEDQYVFSSEGPGEAINLGRIEAADGGFVALISRRVTNGGLIRAQLGEVLLASGSAVTLDIGDSGLVSYQIDEAALGELDDVANLDTGQIIADGGRVILAASVANSLAATVVNQSGLVRAQSIGEGPAGEILLSARGGNIDARFGDTTTLSEDASSGGNILIGASAVEVSEGSEGVGGTVRLGVVSAHGDLTVSADHLLQLSGDLRAEGNIELTSRGERFQSDTLFDRGVLVADSEIELRAGNNILIFAETAPSLAEEAPGQVYLENASLITNDGRIQVILRDTNFVGARDGQVGSLSSGGRIQISGLVSEGGGDPGPSIRSIALGEVTAGGDIAAFAGRISGSGHLLSEEGTVFLGTEGSSDAEITIDGDITARSIVIGAAGGIDVGSLRASAPIGEDIFPSSPFSAYAIVVQSDQGGVAVGDVTAVNTASSGRFFLSTRNDAARIQTGTLGANAPAASELCIGADCMSPFFLETFSPESAALPDARIEVAGGLNIDGTMAVVGASSFVVSGQSAHSGAHPALVNGALMFDNLTGGPQLQSVSITGRHVSAVINPDLPGNGESGEVVISGDGSQGGLESPSDGGAPLAVSLPALSLSGTDLSVNAQNGGLALNGEVIARTIDLQSDGHVAAGTLSALEGGGLTIMAVGGIVADAILSTGVPLMEGGPADASVRIESTAGDILIDGETALSATSSGGGDARANLMIIANNGDIALERFVGTFADAGGVSTAAESANITLTANTIRVDEDIRASVAQPLQPNHRADVVITAATEASLVGVSTESGDIDLQVTEGPLTFESLTASNVRVKAPDIVVEGPVFAYGATPASEVNAILFDSELGIEELVAIDTLGEVRLEASNGDIAVNNAEIVGGHISLRATESIRAMDAPDEGVQPLLAAYRLSASADDEIDLSDARVVVRGGGAGPSAALQPDFAGDDRLIEGVENADLMGFDDNLVDLRLKAPSVSLPLNDVGGGVRYIQLTANMLTLVGETATPDDNVLVQVQPFTPDTPMQLVNEASALTGLVLTRDGLLEHFPGTVFGFGGDSYTGDINVGPDYGTGGNQDYVFLTSGNINSAGNSVQDNIATSGQVVVLEAMNPPPPPPPPPVEPPLVMSDADLVLLEQQYAQPDPQADDERLEQSAQEASESDAATAELLASGQIVRVRVLEGARECQP